MNKLSSNWALEIPTLSFNEIIWFYPSGLETETDKYVLFNYADNVWSYGSIGRSGWSDSGIRKLPNASYVNGKYSSGAFSGIEKSIIYNHEDGYMDDNSKMDSYIESAYFDIEDGDSSMFVDRMSPDFEGMGGTSPELNIVVTAKNYPSSSASKTKTLSATTSTDFVNTRIRGRTMSLKFDDSSSSATTAGWRLGDSRLRIKPDGRR